MHVPSLGSQVCVTAVASFSCLFQPSRTKVFDSSHHGFDFLDRDSRNVASFSCLFQPSRTKVFGSSHHGFDFLDRDSRNMSSRTQKISKMCI